MMDNKPRIDGLLYDRDCPFGYHCLTVDCMECIELHESKEETA